jgi:RNA polymerase sigma-70 factor (TIGR02960 family)
MTHAPEDDTMTDAAPDPLVAAAIAGDEAAFARLVERHRRELHVHCYRMLGSFDEAEDVVQETYLRAWRKRDTFSGDRFRAWLYRIATNASLDTLRRRSRQGTRVESPADVPHLQPYPDRLLDELAPSDDEPDAVVVARETIELAFLAAIQLLPGRQRAALIARDVLGWSAAETAELLGTSVAAANSALQRARATLEEHGPPGRDAAPVAGGVGGGGALDDLTDDERALLQGYIESMEQADPDKVVAIAREDIRVTMPPHPMVFDGLAGLEPLLRRAFDREETGEWRLVATRANRMPAAANYLREPGDTVFRAFKLDVLRVADGGIAEITTFGHSLFPEFGLPATLEG